MGPAKPNKNPALTALPLPWTSVRAFLFLMLFSWTMLLRTGAQEQVRYAEIPVVAETLSVDVNLITVPFTVTDNRGNFVGHLKSDAFKVYENDKPQVIASFAAETVNRPANIALLIDSSYSVSRHLDTEKDAAARFFRLVLRSPGNRALAATFNTDLDYLQDYTSDPGVLTQRILQIRAGGATRLIDSVYAVIERKLAAENGQRVIIIISDGDDNLSRIPLADAIEEAQRFDVLIYAVRVDSELSRLSSPILDAYMNPLRGAEILKELTEKTGGVTFVAEKPQDFKNALSGIATVLKSRYTIQYQSTNAHADGTYRRIRIEVAQGKYHVRCRDGYFSVNSAAAGDHH
jgi:VWFA-related protein